MFKKSVYLVKHKVNYHERYDNLADLVIGIIEKTLFATVEQMLCFRKLSLIPAVEFNMPFSCLNSLINLISADTIISEQCIF